MSQQQNYVQNPSNVWVPQQGDASGNTKVVPTTGGAAGVPAGDVQSAQGISGGYPLNVNQIPEAFGALGVYQATVLSGTMAAGLAADAEILQFRWTDATRIALIHEVTFDALSGSATAFTAGFGRVYATVARAFTVAGTGGTTATMTTNNAKLRASMGTSLLGELRYSQTATLTAGTKVLDATPLGQYPLSFGTVVSVNYLPTPIKLFHRDGVNSMPLALATNEGVIIRAVVPATGTWQWGATIKWSEVAAYPTL